MLVIDTNNSKTRCNNSHINLINSRTEFQSWKGFKRFFSSIFVKKIFKRFHRLLDICPLANTKIVLNFPASSNTIDVSKDFNILHAHWKENCCNSWAWVVTLVNSRNKYLIFVQFLVEKDLSDLKRRTKTEIFMFSR